MLVRRSTLTLLMVVLLASLQSCTGGPYFKWIDPVPDGMAILYVFRAMDDFGDWPSQSVYVNDRKVALLSRHAYTSYVTPPGLVTVRIRGLRQAYIRFKAEVGKSYFLKSSINKISSKSTATGIEVLVFDVLVFMEPETGLQEIRHCRLSSDTSALYSY
jgi:hypothetical protein